MRDESDRRCFIFMMIMIMVITGHDGLPPVTSTVLWGMVQDVLRFLEPGDAEELRVHT